MGPEKQWTNPHDPNGANWFPPTLSGLSDTIVPINEAIGFTAEGSDANGSIKGYLWSFDHGVTWDSVWLPNKQTHLWKRSETGAHVVLVRAMDNDGLTSAVDSFTALVHSFIPVLSRVRDTVVSQQAGVTIAVSAFDTNSGISRYYWRTQPGPWTDSTSAPQKTFSRSQGGPLTVWWGVMDSDTCVSDSFTVLFNRGPTSVNVVEPAAGVSAPFLSYNFVDAEGRIRIAYKGVDPDGDADTLTYTLFLGAGDGPMTPAYAGRAESFIAEHVQALTKYNWKVTVKDLFGDSIESTGVFTAAAAPGAPTGMVLIRSGSKSFIMGQNGFEGSEMPAHQVTLSYHFWMDSTEVTQKDFAEALGRASGQTASSALPAANCTWFDAALYCNARSRRDGKDTVYSYQSIIGTKGAASALTGVSADMTAGGYRLPTEAEWEYACRAQTASLFYWGDDKLDAETYAWLQDYSGNQAHAVATRRANVFSLYDMVGNVWEWCNDWFGADYYAASPGTDPMGPANGQERCIRGGSFQTTYYFAQSAARSRMKPDIASPSIGFRAVLVNR
jgi:formylglycine-generating enzyme required for sulfatase activity